MSLFISNEMKSIKNWCIKLKSTEKSIYLSEEALVDSEEFKILDKSGELRNNGVIVLNNIPVSIEGKGAFEKRFLARARAIENVSGFIAIRTMAPVNGNTYIILTQWESESDFKSWQTSSAYKKAHTKRNTKEGLDQKEGVLQRKPYHNVYDVQEVTFPAN